MIGKWFFFLLQNYFCEEDFLNEESDIEVRGFPGQNDKSYVCYHSRRTIYKYSHNDDSNDIEGMDDIFINVFKSIEKKKDDTHFIIKYTNQTSGGQSGGPLILYGGDDEIQLIGILVSGNAVIEICFSVVFFFRRRMQTIWQIQVFKTWKKKHPMI